MSFDGVSEIPAAQRRLILLWVILVAISVFSVGSVHGLSWFGGSRGQAFAILSLAFIKVRIVVLDFMEVRSAPTLLRAIVETWILAVWVALWVLCLLSAG
jgi:Prokaryotic Cytochrome C oxidase subunit IV